jgi:glycosidase
MNKIAKGEENVSALDAYFKKDTILSPDAIRMQFITNHDENSWNGTVQERLGDATDAMAVLSYTVPGMPLIYSGQEAGLDKRLPFFEKDEIDWNKDLKLGDFYKSLIKLKNENKALWNGLEGGELNRISTVVDSIVFAFSREKNDSKVLVIINLSKDHIRLNLENVDKFKGMKRYFTEGTLEDGHMEFKPWEYRVYLN